MASHEDILRQLSALYDIREYLGIGSRKNVIVCPLPQHNHKNNTPSFSIYESHAQARQLWKCQGNCGLQGDAIDLAGYMHIPGYDCHNIEDIDRAIALLERRVDVRPPKAITPPPRLALSTWSVLPAADKTVERYFAGREIGKEALRHFDVRRKGRHAAIATFEEGKLMMIKYRRMSGVGSRFYTEAGSRASLFNHDEVNGTTKPVLVVKSEVTAIYMWERLRGYGIDVCAPNSGENATLDHSYFQPIALAEMRVYVADNDRDPGTHEKMHKFAKKRAITLGAELQFPLEQYKDIDDWLNERPGDMRKVLEWFEK